MNDASGESSRQLLLPMQSQLRETGSWSFKNRIFKLELGNFGNQFESHPVSGQTKTTGNAKSKMS